MEDNTTRYPVQDIAPPVFAPLPVPFVMHLRQQVFATMPLLEQYVRLYRTSVYTYMEPFVMSEQKQRQTHASIRRAPMTIDTGWLISSLALNPVSKRPIPLPTLSDWHKRGLLRYRSWGFPDFHSAAALLLMRMLNPRPRGWLPSNMSVQEPDWWCWRQDAPEQPTLPCPYPLPPEVPDSALLWTPWSGAAWDDDWVQLGNKGAIRWKGVKQRSEKCWALSHEDLARWDPAVLSLYQPLILLGYGGSRVNEQFMHVVATAALYRLAQGRLL